MRLFMYPILLMSLLLNPGFRLLERVLMTRTGKPGLPNGKTDTDRNYTTIGAVGLTISNFGTIGTRNAYWPDQPSCEYPRGSRIEHLYQGGLWVGAVSRRTGQIHVTTGSSDRVSTTTGKGFEFISVSGTSVVQRSTLSESQYFSPDAVSHQDFLADYSDSLYGTVRRPTRRFRSDCLCIRKAMRGTFLSPISSSF